MIRQHRLIGVALMVLPATVWGAGSVYQTTDEQGRPVYTDQRPAGRAPSREIQIPPPPTEEEVRRAEEETRRTKERADAMQRERLNRERPVREAPKDDQVPPPSTQVPPESLQLNPQLDPADLERYLRDNSFIPPPPAPPSPSR